jgi:Ca2+-binding EF-hand superfamily protein
MGMRRLSVADVTDDMLDEAGLGDELQEEGEEDTTVRGRRRRNQASPFEGDKDGAATTIQCAYRGYRGRAAVASRQQDRDRIKSSQATSKMHLDLYAALGDHSVLYSGPNAELHKTWVALDSSGNGTLDRGEFNELNKKLHVKWNIKEAWRALLEVTELVDQDQKLQDKVTAARGGSTATAALAFSDVKQMKPPEVSFRAFVTVYNQQMGAKRRKIRERVHSMFEEEPGAADGLDEIGTFRFITKRQKYFMLLAPDYERHADWRLLLELSGMEADGTARVKYDNFERWWKHRVGLMEADTPVIPEYFEFKMSEMSAAGRVTAEAKRRKELMDNRETLLAQNVDVDKMLREGFTSTRSGSILWDLLRPRLKVIMTMRKVWGDIDDVYGHPESKHNESASMKWYLRDPGILNPPLPVRSTRYTYDVPYREGRVHRRPEHGLLGYCPGERASVSL